MENLVQATDDFILKLLTEKLPNTFVYHNYTHSKRVYKNINEIIEHSQISVKDTTILRLAALLHDVGYTVSVENHEIEGAKIARRFLESKNVEEDIIKGVEECILATKFKDTVPKNELEMMIRDADSSHFGKEYFNETSEFFRQELSLQNREHYTPKEWLDENIRVFVEDHRFYTDYALKNWQPTKEENLSQLLAKKKKEKEKHTREKEKAQLKAKYKNDSPERGIQTFYRVALRNHLKLSDIADTKANILLSVNAIIISLALANLIPYIDTPSHRHLMIPTLILVLFSVASIIGSIMSTRPNVTSGEFTREQVANKDVNVLFFGNFHQMPYKEFEWAMNEILKDQTYVYNSLSRDLYYLGVVLNRKYRLLRITYTIFMIGIILSVCAFIITFYLT